MRYILVVTLFIVLTGCKVVDVVEKPVILTSIEYRDKLQIDSIHLHDSVYIQRLNDTVFMEHFKTEYRFKLRVDTFIKVDSIPVPYAVIKQVNSLNKWQKVVQALGYIAIGAILLCFLLLIIKLI